MQKFQRLLFVLKRLYVCYHIICMSVPLRFLCYWSICNKFLFLINPTKQDNMLVSYLNWLTFEILSYLSNFLAAQSQRFKASGFTPFTYNAWQRFSNIGVFRILPKVYNGAFLWKQSTVFSANYFQKNLHHRCLKRFSIRLWASEIVFSTTVSVILNSFLGHAAKLKTKYAAKVAPEPDFFHHYYSPV